MVVAVAARKPKAKRPRLRLDDGGRRLLARVKLVAVGGMVACANAAGSRAPASCKGFACLQDDAGHVGVECADVGGVRWELESARVEQISNLNDEYVEMVERRGDDEKVLRAVRVWPSFTH